MLDIKNIMFHKMTRMSVIGFFYKKKSTKIYVYKNDISHDLIHIEGDIISLF